MAQLIAQVHACQGCGACLLTCPEHAIRPTGAALPDGPALTVLADLCTGCGECVEVCPVDAIDLVSQHPAARH
ncbi:MAG TPA: 4Fe-4S binding protein [Candidatus Limnocylindrales bacterium]|nr:4Fe-4S binding protein [Candidatus Limnocylindrales bacterium]